MDSQPTSNNNGNNLLSVNPNLLSFADHIYNRYRDLYNEKTLYGRKGKATDI
jgi:hypothetical protein